MAGSMAWRIAWSLILGFTLSAVVQAVGAIVVVLVALFFRLFVRDRLVDGAREQAEKGVAGSMEGHAAMDMSVENEGSWWRRLLSGNGITAVSHI